MRVIAIAHLQAHENERRIATSGEDNVAREQLLQAFRAMLQVPMTVRDVGADAKRRVIAALILTVMLAAPPARGDTPTSAPSSGAGTTDAQARAEEHFKRAKELYGTGAYREAAAELEAAHALDPNAKELVFNLGVVSEKLGKFDDALRWFREYTKMAGTTEAERQKAESAIRRLEGAKRETPEPPTTAPAPPPPARPRGPERAEEMGRIDEATIAAASVAVVGLGVGTFFAFKALGDRPKTNFVTGKDGTYDDLQNQVSKAHREAIVADVGFGVGIVAAGIATYLFASRTKVAPSTSKGARVSVSPVPYGGAFVVQGTF
jgi:tetratricopeptide (TPR) repeat protein